MLTPPRTTTPEIRAVVTGFIAGEESLDAGGWKDEQKQKLKTCTFFDRGLT